jgi:hypothetical protein
MSIFHENYINTLCKKGPKNKISTSFFNQKPSANWEYFQLSPHPSSIPLSIHSFIDLSIHPFIHPLIYPSTHPGALVWLSKKKNNENEVRGFFFLN